MDKKLIFRLLTVPLLMYCFYMLSWPIELILILGIIFVLIILLRGKVWAASEKGLEKFLPFTKTWPEWARKILLMIIFFIIYAIIKQIIFFSLGLVGIHIGEQIASIYTQTK